MTTTTSTIDNYIWSTTASGTTSSSSNQIYVDYSTGTSNSHTFTIPYTYSSMMEYRCKVLGRSYRQEDLTPYLAKPCDIRTINIVLKDSPHWISHIQHLWMNPAVQHHIVFAQNIGKHELELIPILQWAFEKVFKIR